MWPNLTPILSPGFTSIIFEETGDWKPDLQAKFASFTFWIGLLLWAVRMPTARPLSCPLTRTFWAIQCAADNAGRRDSAAAARNFITRDVVPSMSVAAIDTGLSSRRWLSYTSIGPPTRSREHPKCRSISVSHSIHHSRFVQYLKFQSRYCSHLLPRLAWQCSPHVHGYPSHPSIDGGTSEIGGNLNIA